jgi:peptidoglycan/LPS O-acetylase OafA/YrhL
MFMAHPRLVSYYLAGTVCASWSALVRPRAWAVIASLLALGVTGVLGRFDVVAPIAFSCLVFAAAFPGKPDFSRFASRGDLSYGIYLYAWPLQQLFVSYWAERLTPTLLTAIVFVCTVVLAALSWRLVERPALTLKRTGAPGVHSPKAAST